MPRPIPSDRRVAPGVDRLGDDVVNFYLVQEPDGLVLVDAGLPAHLKQLREHLADSGRSLTDIRAVLLTHGHPDHTGLAHTLQQAGADIWIHGSDAAILHDGPRSALRHAKPERSALPYLLRRPTALATPLHLARTGAFTAPATPGVRAFDTDRQLDEVPGKPRAVPLPGHTPGSTGYLFPQRGLLFTGDALVTHDGLTGHTGPTLVCRGFTHDSRTALTSLDRIDELTETTLLLPGHGHPLTGDPRTATRQARQTGPR
ncbi:MBL fold metallo-hydrolase [Kitasatospora cineracea]|uniref:Glyoxylase-like metal-dependent hydrolase (Beta-lactamase superfamily II) n=1 Tax=Kitasatospora cineracea TaxID=88074 RepID=A0A8G1UMP1_9ACTN|nr:MBL fold metallo-hydrolase [Kitasatospora cineracea]ROR46930.1 glyoxylase-like metal-dependent hydrolase (beta-lactamase superfamily II) [Kitasatospora cineracea]